MPEVRVRWNMSAFAELRTAPAVMAALDEIADGIAERAGDGFEAQPAAVTGGRIRGRAAVVTTTVRAMRRQARDHILERSL